MSDSFYTTGQLIILEGCSVVTGFISLISSSIVIYSQLKHRKRRLKQMYERIILGSSTVDVIMSAGFAFLGIWAVPSEVDFVLGARGSFTTCSLLGFMSNFGLGALVYFASLALFFVLLVVFEVQERTMSKCFEPCIHSIAFGVPLASGFYALSIHAMNPVEGLPGNCWINEYPPHCVTQDEMDAIAMLKDKNLEASELCLRGEGFETLAYVCGAGLIGLTFLVIIVSMFCIILKVYLTERNLRAYMSSTDSQRGGAGTTVLSTGSDLVKTQQTCWKALFYIGSFVITCFGIVSYQLIAIQNLDQSETRELHFTFALFTKIFAPLHGFWQSLIYFRYAPRETRDDVTSVISGLHTSVSSAIKSASRTFSPSALFQNFPGEVKPEVLDPPRITDFQPASTNSRELPRVVPSAATTATRVKKVVRSGAGGNEPESSGNVELFDEDPEAATDSIEIHEVVKAIGNLGHYDPHELEEEISV